MFRLKPEGEIYLGCWAGLYLSAISLNDSIDLGNVKLTGDKKEILQIFDMFDEFEASQNDMVMCLEDIF